MGDYLKSIPKKDYVSVVLLLAFVVGFIFSFTAFIQDWVVPNIPEFWRSVFVLGYWITYTFVMIGAVVVQRMFSKQS